MRDRTLRASQRAPASCSTCAARKVKCDKNIPCTECIRRGSVATCSREPVRVRGEIKISGAKTEETLSYRSLLIENERLRACSRAQVATFLRGRRNPAPCFVSEYGQMLLDQVATTGFTSELSNDSFGFDCILMPAAATSEYLIAYDKVWNSWIHCALEYPNFEQECFAFMASLSQGQPLHTIDPAWLAVYFSVICAALLILEDRVIDTLGLPEGHGRRRLVLNWYNAALFCLNKADFMRASDVRVVQSIAILNMCFNTLGDPYFGSQMLRAALGIARSIGLNTGFSEKATPLTAECQHRLWWTLVICEWLSMSPESTQIDPMDFDVPLPQPPVEVLHGIPVHPVLFHTLMIHIASVFYRFRYSVRGGYLPVDECVRLADIELGNIIATLPLYLQPDNADTAPIMQLEEQFPWFRWQRSCVAILLLYHRIRIHQVLEKEWESVPEKYGWARGVCIRSASEVLYIVSNWDQCASMRNHWMIAFYVFNAASILVRESRAGGEQTRFKIKAGTDLERSLSYLEEIKGCNALAEGAIRSLRTLIAGTP